MTVRISVSRATEAFSKEKEVVFDSQLLGTKRTISLFSSIKFPSSPDTCHSRAEEGDPEARQYKRREDPETRLDTEGSQSGDVR